MPVPRIVIDRIEGDIAVLMVGDASVDIPVALLPEGAGEGSVLTLALASSQADSAALAERLATMQAKSGIGDDFTF